jgi:hypothetical protein
MSAGASKTSKKMPAARAVRSLCVIVVVHHNSYLPLVLPAAHKITTRTYILSAAIIRTTIIIYITATNYCYISPLPISPRLGINKMVSVSILIIVPELINTLER